MRFLIDCTFVYKNPDMNSGIQRVVRNIINNTSSLKFEDEIECLAVIFTRKGISRVSQLSPSTLERATLSILGKLGFVIGKLRSFYDKNSNNDSSKPSYFRRIVSGVTKGLILFFQILWFVTVRLQLLFGRIFRARPMALCEQDVLILLDASWQQDFHPFIENAKSRGHTVVGVIYDLIPITHPHYFDEVLVREFKQWFEWITKTADGYMTISKTVRDQAEQLIRAMLPAQEFESRWFDYFYLGSELDLAQHGMVRNSVRHVFDGSLPVYLMVSTVEPRKNHVYLLNAFEELWKQDQNVVLCFIGRIGWKSKSLLERIENHPELDERFFMFNDLNDTELEYAYKHSKALVFSSFMEGFGLPIVEAMQRGLPAMVSDTPVFREVGGDYCTYFKLDDFQSLVKLVMEFESTGEFPSVKLFVDYQWLTWERASEKFIYTVKGNVTQQSA